MRNYTTSRPFSTASTYDYFRQRDSDLANEIESLENDYVLKASASELEDYFLSKYLLEPLTLAPDGYYMDKPRSVDMAVHSDFGFDFPNPRAKVRQRNAAFNFGAIYWVSRPLGPPTVSVYSLSLSRTDCWRCRSYVLFHLPG